jgi:polyphosphate kinase
MSAKTHESGTHLSLTRVKPKRGKVRPVPAATLADQALAPREGLLAHAWIDRDLSWLDFNRRVLHEALDERTPLLERLKFLAIFTSNLDEFYMKRVGLLRGVAQVESEDWPGGACSGDARDRLAQSPQDGSRANWRNRRAATSDLIPILAGHGIILAGWSRADCGATG